jgi:signal transduction histidine kinase
VIKRVSRAGRTVDGGSEREVRAVREIAHAFLTAENPAEVYRLALERVVPLVGAAFGCVFLREPEDPELLYVVAAHDWPERYRGYLSEMRVRLGNGPTGQAVEENRVILVPDVFADEGLRDWWESARELGFTSSVSLPLAFDGVPAGALTFYFQKADPLAEADRHLLRLVADQLAGTAQKAHLIDDLQQTNRLLRDQNVELEARYREAEEARRLKNEFLANVSHELRTPLTAILGYTYLLREGLSGDLAAEQGQAVEKIETAGNALMALISDLLDLTHLKLGRTVVEAELCDAVALARAAVSAAPQPPGRVRLMAETPEERIPIHTDPVLVLRILQHLISNALKFTSEGAVTVRLTQTPGRNGSTRGPTVIWEVHDTGIGISPEHQATIFDEFRQVDGSATRRFGGAGLGLALSRGLARRLGGDLSVRSTPEEGSCFTLALPSQVVHAGGERGETDGPAAEAEAP